jgi:hypothetical protein
MFLELHSCFTLKIDFSIHACFICPLIHEHRASCAFFSGGDYNAMHYILYRNVMCKT